MKQTIIIAIRIVSLPFIIGITLVFLIALFFKMIISFLLFGGEFITYYDKNERKTIMQLYEKLKQLNYEHNIRSDDKS